MTTHAEQTCLNRRRLPKGGTSRRPLFGFYWKDFVDEETQKDRHRRAIENSVSRIEQTRQLDFKETMRNLDKDVDTIPVAKTKPILKKKITKESDDSQKYKHGQHVKVFCLEGKNTG